MVNALDSDVHNYYYYVHQIHLGGSHGGWFMARQQLDQGKLNRAKSVLGAKTETEAVDRALDLVVAEAEVDKVLRGAKGRARLRKVFR